MFVAKPNPAASSCKQQAVVVKSELLADSYVPGWAQPWLHQGHKLTWGSLDSYDIVILLSYTQR